jgi:hypothetical protein
MKRNLLFKILLGLTLSAGLLYISCNGENSDDEVNQDNDKPDLTGKAFKFKNRIFSVPSPFHVSELIKKISADYNEDYLNPVLNKNNYITTEKKALNLGVFMADLAYCNIFEQYSSTTQYIKAVKELSSDLQIMNAFTDKIMEHLEKNIENTDSLNKIFTEAYREADLYLSDNNREETAILIVSGGWTEGLYLMIKIAEENKNQLLISRIGEQKYALKNLISMLSQFKLESTVSDEILNKLYDLQQSFERIEINYTYDKKIVIPNEKKTIIISETEILINEQILNEISEKTVQLRNFIIK